MMTLEDIKKFKVGDNVRLTNPKTDRYLKEHGYNEGDLITITILSNSNSFVTKSRINIREDICVYYDEVSKLSKVNKHLPDWMISLIPKDSNH